MYYPIMLEIKNKKCIVFGGGQVAFRKTTALLNCGASITVVSPSLCHELENRCSQEKIKYINAQYNKAYLDEAYLCFGCTGDKEVNGRIARDAKEKGIFANIADDGQSSSFIVPAVRRKKDITLAVSANENPAASRYTAEFLSGKLENWFLDYVTMVKQLREKIKGSLKDTKVRQGFMKKLFTEEYINTARKNLNDARLKAEELLESTIEMGEKHE